MAEMAYLVGGDTGEYSDHCSWYVRICLDRATADALCERLNAWCKERGLAEEHSRWDGKEHPPEDPSFRHNYTGTWYSVAEIPLDVARTLRVADR